MTLEELKKYSFFEKKEISSFQLLKNQGVCNIIYKVKTSKKNYLIRVFKHTHKNPLARNLEFKIQNKAHKYKLTSKAHILEEQKSFMICDFIKGKHKKVLKKKDIQLIVKNLKILHKIKINIKAYNLKKDIKAYSNILKDSKSKKLINKSLKEFKKLEKYNFEPVLCHHDLNYKNVLFFKNNAYFIDWEFACINDLYFDLANICIEFNLNKKEERFLLKKYFLKIDSSHIYKLKSYKILYTNLWKLWFKTLK